jgi:hypothetical protein
MLMSTHKSSMRLFNFIEFMFFSFRHTKPKRFVKERVTGITCEIIVLDSSRMNKKLVLYVLEP